MRRLMVICFLLIATSALSAVPRLVNYQGFLMESPNGPPLEGSYDLLFQIYPDSLGGSSLWLENHLQVPVEHGVFNVILGELQPFPSDLFAAGNLWLDVYVPNLVSGLPRMKLTSVVWAMHASIADTALFLAGDLPLDDYSVSELSDVSLDAPAIGDVLTWNGSTWTPDIQRSTNVDPDSPSGIAAITMVFTERVGGSSNLMVLMIDGRVLYTYSNSYWVEASSTLPDNLTVSDIRQFSGGLSVSDNLGCCSILTHSGQIYQLLGSGEQWALVPSPPTK